MVHLRTERLALVLEALGSAEPAILDRVAAPIADKMLECGMIP
jgi:hypothetical protein